jgi:hypothetical protein
MKRNTLFTFAVVGMLLIAPQVNADVVLSDNFDRADGSLVPTVPTPGPGGAWANHSGTPGDLLISSGQVVVQHGAPSEDAHSQFADVTTGTLSANFDITVNGDVPIIGTDNEYFAHFMTDGSFNFTSRLYVVEANDVNNDYTFGLSVGSGGSTDKFSTDFAYGNQINGTLNYDFGTGLASFTVGSATITSSLAGTESLLNSFALRQSDSANNETILVDNLVVSTGTAVPEPGSLAVLGLMGLVGLVQRRRK